MSGSGTDGIAQRNVRGSAAAGDAACVLSLAMGDVRGHGYIQGHSSGEHRHRRSRWAAGACAAIVGLGALLTACSSGPVPQTTASAYLSDWAKQDWSGMQQLVSQPPANFTAVNQAAFTGLTVQKASFTAGTVTTKGSTAREPVTEKFQLRGLGTITLTTTLRLVAGQQQAVAGALGAVHDHAEARPGRQAGSADRPGRPGPRSWAPTGRP